MRLWPKNPWRPLVLLAVGGAVIGYRLYLAHVPQRIHDVLHLIPDEQEQQANIALYALQSGYGADIHVVIDSLAADRTVEEAALDWMRSAKIGRRTSGRGMLVLIDFGSGRMRIEVTPALQGVFTDAFSGYLLRNHLRAFTNDRQVELGVRGLIILLTFRLQQALLDEEWDPTALATVREWSDPGDGGGASSVTRSRESPSWRRRLPASIKETLGPQPTPDAAFAAYLRWAALDPADPRVDLFTPQSQAALDALPYTRPFFDLELLKYGNRPYRIVERGDMAMVYVTNTPLVGPMLFRRLERGWQIDVIDEWKHVSPLVNDPYVWGWRKLNDDWDQTFDDEFIDNRSQTWRWLKHGDMRRIRYGKLKW